MCIRDRAERVFEFLDEEEEDQTAENPVDITTIEGNVEARHVAFGYQPEHLIIHDFSGDVKAGQKLSLIHILDILQEKGYKFVTVDELLLE